MEDGDATPGSAVRYGLLVIPHEQPLGSSPALLAGEPAPDLLEQHVGAVLIRQLFLVQNNAPVTVPTERRQGEGVVVRQGAEDDRGHPRTRTRQTG